MHPPIGKRPQDRQSLLLNSTQLSFPVIVPQLGKPLSIPEKAEWLL